MEIINKIHSLTQTFTVYIKAQIVGYVLNHHSQSDTEDIWPNYWKCHGYNVGSKEQLNVIACLQGKI